MGGKSEAITAKHTVLSRVLAECSAAIISCDYPPKKKLNAKNSCKSLAQLGKRSFWKPFVSRFWKYLSLTGSVNHAIFWPLRSSNPQQKGFRPGDMIYRYPATFWSPPPPFCLPRYGNNPEPIPLPPESQSSTSSPLALLHLRFHDNP